MSDFDKEAEREKLREKFESEEDKRADTEQMSELLLKGATMTNAHCSDCGDPIFRYDGQEFCPSCQKPVARDQGETADGEDGGSDDADDEQIQVADPSDEARVQFGGGDQSADAEAGGPGDDGTPQADAATDPTAPEPSTAAERGADEVAEPSRRVPSADPEHTPDETTDESGDQRADRERQASRRSEADDPATEPRGGTSRAPGGTPSASPRDHDDADAALAEAESLLAETVRRFAERAAATDDPRRAREHLTAAREAADALDATRF